MTKRATTPVLELTPGPKGVAHYCDPHDIDRAIAICLSALMSHALPSWKGEPPHRVRFHVTRSPRGSWEWSRGRLSREIRTPDERFLCTSYGVDDWFETAFLSQVVRFNVEMEIVEP